MLGDQILVEQPACHPDGIAEAPFIKRPLMVGQSGLFPRAFGVPHHEKRFGHGLQTGKVSVVGITDAAKISRIWGDF